MTLDDRLTQALQGDLEGFIEALPPYQRSSVEVMLSRAGTPLEAARLWLEAAGPVDTAPFGGSSKAAQLLLENLVREMAKAICGSEQYQEEREPLLQAASAGKYAVAAAVGAVIGPHVGAAAVVLAPAIVLILSVVAEAGKKTVCEVLDEMIANFESASGDQGSRDV